MKTILRSPSCSTDVGRRSGPVRGGPRADAGVGEGLWEDGVVEVILDEVGGAAEEPVQEADLLLVPEVQHVCQDVRKRGEQR